MMRILRKLLERPVTFEHDAVIRFNDDKETFISAIHTTSLTSCLLTAKCRTIFIDGKKTFFTVGNRYQIDFPDSEPETLTCVLSGVDYCFKEESFLITFDTETPALYRRLKSRKTRRQNKAKGAAN